MTRRFFVPGQGPSLGRLARCPNKTKNPAFGGILNFPPDASAVERILPKESATITQFGPRSRYNPLAEIRVGGDKAMVDALAILHIMRDPDGTKVVAASSASAHRIHARMLIAIREEAPDANLRDAAKLARDLAECLEGHLAG